MSTERVNGLIDVLESIRPEIERTYRHRLKPIEKRYGVDDLYQDICTKVLSHGHKCRGRTIEELRGFLVVVARNTCMNALSRHITAGRRSILRDAHDDGPIDRHLSHCETPLEHLCIQETVAEVLAMLRTIPPRQRKAIEQRMLLEESYAEIGQELGVTLQAVRSLVSRGLQAVRTGIEAMRDDSLGNSLSTRT